MEWFDKLGEAMDIKYPRTLYRYLPEINKLDFVQD